MNFAPNVLEEIDRIVARYPRPTSAVLPVLHVVQREHGFVPPEAKAWVAARLDMPPAKVEEVCRSLSCNLRGEEEITATIRSRIGIDPGGKTADGKFSLVQVECLGSCGTAPMMQVNDDYHENLTPRRVEELLEEWSR
jgi:NADH:ubiquinone oxidoreductase subunit E